MLVSLDGQKSFMKVRRTSQASETLSERFHSFRRVSVRRFRRCCRMTGAVVGLVGDRRNPSRSADPSVNSDPLHPGQAMRSLEGSIDVQRETRSAVVEESRYLQVLESTGSEAGSTGSEAGSSQSAVGCTVNNKTIAPG